MEVKRGPRRDNDCGGVVEGEGPRGRVLAGSPPPFGGVDWLPSAVAAVPPDLDPDILARLGPERVCERGCWSHLIARYIVYI